MATVSVETSVEVDIEDVLEECTTNTLVKALQERKRLEVIEALQKGGLLKISEESPEMGDLENMISAFNSGDRTLFEISLQNLFPAAKTQITFDLHNKQLRMVA